MFDVASYPGSAHALTTSKRKIAKKICKLHEKRCRYLCVGKQLNWPTLYRQNRLECKSFVADRIGLGSITLHYLAVLAQYKQSRGFDQIHVSHALSNIHGLCRCSCNLFDVISIYSLNPCKLPRPFLLQTAWV